MSEDIRQLAHAIVALADSNAGIGGSLREQAANQAETNRILASIHDQNAEILSQMKTFNQRASESEREIRVIKLDHGKRFARIESHIGLPPPEGEQHARLGNGAGTVGGR
jgi:predicted house-cleaning NTP pyrophosphatase (Maf/HAM1 superfamily)